MSNPNLTGKVAIITGAGSPIGLGHSMAAATVQAGGRVAMLDIDEDWLEESAGNIRAQGGERCALPIVVDVTDPQAVRLRSPPSIEQRFLERARREQLATLLCY